MTRPPLHELLRRNEPWFQLFLVASLLPILFMPFTDLDGNFIQRCLLPVSNVILIAVSLRMVPTDLLRLGNWQPFVLYRPLGLACGCLPFILFLLGSHAPILWHLPILATIDGYYLATAVAVVLMLAHVSRVNEAVLCLGAAGYVHLGLTAGQLATTLEVLQPGSFNLGRMLPGEELVERLSYFAFVTLGTLGYGDVVPASPLAESFAVLINVTANLYITLIIGLLLSRYVQSIEAGIRR